MMQAMVLVRPGAPDALDLQLRPIPEPGPGEAVVRLYAAALNHRDLRLFLGTLPGGADPYIPGSDGAGEVAAVGAGVSDVRVGDAVVIDPTLSCALCRWCQAGEQSLCDHFRILGSPGDGTYAQYVKAPAANLHPKPAHLDFTAAAALPLALATAWRAVIGRAALQPGETVLIHGIGGGVALYALQIALGMGARAIVTSGSGAKLQRALAMGAAAGIDYKNEDVAARCQELTDGLGVDVVVDSGGKHTLPISLAAVRKGGRIVNFGVTTGTEGTLNYRTLFWKQVSLLGSTMSSRAEFAQAMRFVAQQKLAPTVSEVFALQDLALAYGRMQRAEQFGKLVLQIP